jgi:hypothetical protein
MKRLATALSLCLLGAALVPGPAAADRDRYDHRDRDRDRYQHHYRQWERHGDIRDFHRHDYDRWRGGRWYHGHHDGRLGWWWVVGGFWYFYNQPVYPYPNPYLPPGVVTAPVPPPPGRYFFYCQPFHDYYPYVTTCPPGGWRLVPVH